MVNLKKDKLLLHQLCKKLAKIFFEKLINIFNFCLMLFACKKAFSDATKRSCIFKIFGHLQKDFFCVKTFQFFKNGPSRKYQKASYM